MRQEFDSASHLLHSSFHLTTPIVVVVFKTESWTTETEQKSTARSTPTYSVQPVVPEDKIPSQKIANICINCFASAQLAGGADCADALLAQHLRPEG